MAMAATLPSALLDFFNSCSEQQLNHLQEALQQTQAHHAQQAPSNVPSNMTPASSVTATKNGTKNSKKPRKNSAKAERGTGGPPKRPLNSWMAFRKYYSASLAPNTQKSISKILTTWWQADPFEAKWALLAKAYSILRASRDKAEVLLDGFFAICAPMLNIIPPAQYPVVMGWQILSTGADSENKTPQLVRVYMPDLNQLMLQYRGTISGVDDLITACKHAGFIQANDQRGPSAKIAMAVRPSAVLTVPEEPSFPQQDMLAPISPDSQILMHNLQTHLRGSPVAEEMLADAAITLHNSGSQYPHNNMFSLGAQFNFNLDPNNVNGATFDAFEPAVLGGGFDNGGIEWDRLVYDGFV